MARSSSPRRSRRPLWPRRLRLLAVLATVAGLVYVVRALLLRQDEQQFEQRYPRDGSTSGGSTSDGAASTS